MSGVVAAPRFNPGWLGRDAAVLWAPIVALTG